MRHNNYYFLILIVLFSFSNCKKNDSPIDISENEEDVYEEIAEISNTLNDGLQIFQDTLNFTNDTAVAYAAMAYSILNQPGVEDVYALGIDHLTIEMKSGHKTSIQFIEVDENDQHLTRGGSSGSIQSFKAKKTEGNTKKIKNNKVLILNPYLSDFYKGGYDNLPLFEQGDLEFDVTIVNNQNVDLSHINSMDEYGFVILNTHGRRDGFNLYSLVELPAPKDTPYTKDEIKALASKKLGTNSKNFEQGELEIDAIAELKKGSNSISYRLNITVTSKYVNNLDIDLTDVVVFGNHCQSGWTEAHERLNSVVTAWKSKGVASYYGYAFDNGVSINVDNEFCVRMEDSLIVNLVQNIDSTGIAHLDPDNNEQFYKVNAIPELSSLKFLTLREMAEFARRASRDLGQKNTPYYFKQFADKGYSYGCGTFTDTRDNEKYNLACIGGTTWFADNLRFKVTGAKSANNKSENDKEYGLLYSWDQMSNGAKPTARNQLGFQGICPNGWHIPSHQDWLNLFDSANVDYPLNHPSDQTTLADSVEYNLEKQGFLNGLLAGQYVDAPTFNEPFWYQNYLYIWAANTHDEGMIPPPESDYTGVWRFSSSQSSNFHSGRSSNKVINPVSKEVFYNSCRCVKD